MPTYHYICNNCSHSFENIEGFHDKRLKKCPECHRQKLRQIYYAPAAIIRSSISGSSGTLGTYAEANDKRIGSYKLSEMESIKQEQTASHKKKHKVKDPFWRKGRPINRKLAKLNKEQKQAYILDGKLPPGFEK